MTGAIIRQYTEAINDDDSRDIIESIETRYNDSDDDHNDSNDHHNDSDDDHNNSDDDHNDSDDDHNDSDDDGLSDTDEAGDDDLATPPFDSDDDANDELDDLASSAPLSFSSPNASSIVRTLPTALRNSDAARS